MLNDILYSTVRIDLVINEDEYENATGFVVSVGMLNKAIITNAHVFQDNQGFPLNFSNCSFYIWITNSDGVKECKEFVLDGKKRSNIMFYSSSEDVEQIDLCAINIRDLIKPNIEFELIPFSFDSQVLLKGQRALESLDVTTQIIMIGYPSGIYDPASQLPVSRTGHISSNPSLDYMGESKFLIDIRTLHGSSGSPVFFTQSNMYRNDQKEPGKYIRDLIDLRFIGIFTEFLKDNIVLDDQKRFEVSKDLGYVLKPNLVMKLMNRMFEPEKKLKQLFPPQ